jgi:hypothetical protein
MKKFYLMVAPSLLIATITALILGAFSAPSWAVFLGFELTYWITLPRGTK